MKSNNEKFIFEGKLFKFTSNILKENHKHRLEEENTKSANLISAMMQTPNFDAESKQGKMVLKTSELFNALSDKGYDVQVTFDNGESESDILLGAQGGKVVITITDTDNKLNAYISGNFEVNNENINTFKEIEDIVGSL